MACWMPRPLSSTYWPVSRVKPLATAQFHSRQHCVMPFTSISATSIPAQAMPVSGMARPSGVMTRAETSLIRALAPLRFLSTRT